MLKYVYTALVALVGVVAGEATLKVHNLYAVEGEMIVFDVNIKNANLSADLKLTSNPDNLLIKNISQRRIRQGRDMIQQYTFSATPQKATGAKVMLPSILLTYTNNKQQVLEGVQVEYVKANQMDWQAASLGEDKFFYATYFALPSDTLYEGQAAYCTLKIVLPASIELSQVGGLAQVETSGISAWRFELENSNHSEIDYNGVKYQVFNFSTTIGALKAGEAQLGPGEKGFSRRVIHSRSHGSGFFRRYESVPFKITIPARKLTIKPLPANAPASFNGAVGEFTMERSVKQTEVLEGDPITLDISISGSGNLEMLTSPSFDKKELRKWQLYPATKHQRGNERKELSGVVRFTQIMRPLEAVDTVPPIEFSYFDPVKERYETLRSQPLPLTIKPLTKVAGGGGALNRSFSSPASAGSLPAVPELAMTDILSIIPNPELHCGECANVSAEKGVFTGLIGACVCVIGLILFHQLQPWFIRRRARKRFLAKLDQLKKLKKQPTEFYREAGRLVEGDLGEAGNSEFDEVLKNRDESSFSLESKAIEKEQINRHYDLIAKAMKRSLPYLNVIMVGALFCLGQVGAVGNVNNESKANATNLTSTVDAAVKAWQDQDWSSAQKIYKEKIKESPSADLYYNLGNTYVKQHKYGKAIASYHQALALEPRHPEALQNLRYVEKIAGAVPFHEPMVSWFTFQSEADWRSWVVIAFLAILFMVLLKWYLKLIRYQGKLANLGLNIGAWVGVLTFCFALYASIHIYFEDQRSFQYHKDDLWIVADLEDVTVKTEPVRNAATVRKLREGTVVKVLLERGHWFYVETPDENRGWLEKSELSDLIEGAS